jgi:RHS repeat-associated protein
MVAPRSTTNSLGIKAVTLVVIFSLSTLSVLTIEEADALILDALPSPTAPRDICGDHLGPNPRSETPDWVTGVLSYRAPLAPATICTGTGEVRSLALFCPGLDPGTFTSPAASGLKEQSWVLTDGNDWNSTTIDGVAESRAHNARHQMVNAATSATTWYTNDPNGNLVHDGALWYQWDFKNRLVRIHDNVSVLHDYTYDAGNRRILDVEPGEVTRFVLDGNQEIEARDGTGALLRQYVFGPGIDELVLMDTFQPVGIAPLVVSVFEERFWYHLNDQQSTIGLTNETGHVVEAYEYSPYGLPFIYTPGPNGEIDWGGDDVVLQGGTSPLGNRVLYTGRSWDDDTGLYFYRSRYMSPEMGRFISSDTIGVWGDAGALGNGYAYVGNGPASATDPTGAWINFVVGAVIGLGAELFMDVVLEGVMTGDFRMDHSLSDYVTSAAVGALTGGTSAFTSNIASTGGRYLARAAIGGTWSGLGETAQQTIEVQILETRCDWNEREMTAAAIGGALGNMAGGKAADELIDIFSWQAATKSLFRSDLLESTYEAAGTSAGSEVVGRFSDATAGIVGESTIEMAGEDC